jgi:hypothetical protein
MRLERSQSHRAQETLTPCLDYGDPANYPLLTPAGWRRIELGTVEWVRLLLDYPTSFCCR